ncbi:hypothetical protein Bbelb_421330 [Branchiostoma belcheri]|nr:hypothetical protein Bbelb_421330 [Branchiostoma belcheri]
MKVLTRVGRYRVDRSLLALGVSVGARPPGGGWGNLPVPWEAVLRYRGPDTLQPSCEPVVLVHMHALPLESSHRSGGGGLYRGSSPLVRLRAVTASGKMIGSALGTVGDPNNSYTHSNAPGTRRTVPAPPSIEQFCV